MLSNLVISLSRMSFVLFVADGCSKAQSDIGKRVVEFLGIAVAVAFVIVLVVVNVHNLAGPSRRRSVTVAASPIVEADLNTDIGAISGGMYAPPGGGLASWPNVHWKGKILTPPSYTEVDLAPPLPSPPPYEMYILPRVEV